MKTLKNILAFVGLLVVAGLVFALVKFDLGTKLSAASQLDSKAMGLYMEMFETVLSTGNAAEGMVRSVKVSPEVSNEDIKDIIESIASENNMDMVADVTMFDGSPLKEGGEKTKYTRIFSLCSRPIAQVFLDYSMAYGAFMPCRIMLEEDDKGDRWLYTMDLGLMIHGGKPLPKKMLEKAEHVRDTLYEAMDKAATGDF